jgi:hypothetical protein
VLELDEEMRNLAKQLKEEQSLLVFGRGYNYATALEAALKVGNIMLSAQHMRHGGPKGSTCSIRQVIFRGVLALYTFSSWMLSAILSMHGYGLQESCLLVLLRRINKRSMSEFCLRILFTLVANFAALWDSFFNRQ